MTATLTDDDLEPRTIRGTLRRWRFWIAIGAVLLLVTVATAIASVGRTPDIPLDATSPGASGSMAVAQVLRDHGVDVDVTSSLADTSDAIATTGPRDTTILFFDGQSILDSAQRAKLLGLADRLVVVDPNPTALVDLAPDVSQAAQLKSVDRRPGCDLPAATNSGTVHSSGTGYSTPDSDASSCFTTKGASGLVQVDSDGVTVTVLGLPEVLTNQNVLTAGNAALALNLLGETDHLIWYLPTRADLADADGAGQSLGDLSPDWVIPLTTLLAIASIAAIAWRSRRFGPLVVENLPVVVRSSETMEGRARLYERGSDRLHALDALRIATVDRLATECGLSRRATVTDVIDAVSAVTGRDRAAVAGILVDANPLNDADLVRLSDDLLRLEHDTAAATRAR